MCELIEIQESNSKSLWFKRKCLQIFPPKSASLWEAPVSTILNNPVQILQMTYLSIQGTPMGQWGHTSTITQVEPH